MSDGITDSCRAADEAKQEYKQRLQMQQTINQLVGAPGKVFPVNSVHEVRKYQPETFEDVLDAKIAECRELMIRKQMDYGVGNIASFGILGVAVRASDKIERLRNLLLKKREPSNESLRDTFMDLANYGLIGMMLLDGQWGKPLKREEAERVGREVK